MFTLEDKEKLEDLLTRVRSTLNDVECMTEQIRDLEKTIQRLNAYRVQEEFQDFIKAGFIPGAVFTKYNAPETFYQIVNIHPECYIAIELGKPQQTYKMPLVSYITGESMLDKYTLKYQGQIDKTQDYLPKDNITR